MTERECITLWEETLEVLKENGKEWDDIYWICVSDKRMYKGDFVKYAQKIHYKPWCFGGNTINLKLRLYGLKFMMIRWEYDGAESWIFLETEPPSEYTMTTDAKVLFDELAWNYGWRKDFEEEKAQ